jgi:hypothetical protein
MAQITQEELSRRLNKNGWAWHLISNMIPGIVRIQLGDDGEEETMWRKCIEAPTLDEAVTAAEKFVESINAYEYGLTRQFGGQDDKDTLDFFGY